MASNPFDELKKWKISDLRKLIDQNNWGIKGRSSDIIITRLQSQIDANQIRAQITKFQPKVSIHKSKGKKINRLTTIENQIQVLFQRINRIEAKINKFSHNTPTIPNQSLEQVLLANIPTGTGILVDALLKLPMINRHALGTIEHTIFNLVDDGKIMVAEGSSRQKLNGYIGRVIKV